MDQPTIGTPLTLALDDDFDEDATHDEKYQTLCDNERIIMCLLQYQACAVSTTICNLSRLLESKRDEDVKERLTRKWIQQGYPVEHECDNIFPPIVTASTRCYLGIIDALLQAGADPNALDGQHGVRPLAHLGSNTGNDDAPLVEAARLLVKAGADPYDVEYDEHDEHDEHNEHNEHKQTILDFIVNCRADEEHSETAFVKLADFFLKEGMCPNAVDGSGRTPFARAINSRNLALSKKIFEYGGKLKRTTRKAEQFIRRRDLSGANSQQAAKPLTGRQMAELIIELLDECPSLLRRV